MLKRLKPTPETLTQPQKTASGLPKLNSRPISPMLNEKQIMAAETADRLFGLIPPLDVGDPKRFIAATIAIFAEYPAEVMDQFPAAIAQRRDRPTLPLIRSVCEEVNAPYAREIERKRAWDSHMRSLPPPEERPITPEERARRAAHAAEVRAALGIGVSEPKKHIAPEPRSDGKHAQRIADDLAARKARKEAEQASQRTEPTKTVIQ
jgi:hypothetical protein